MHAEHGLFPSQGRDLAEQRGAPGHHVPGRTVRIATDRLESGVQGTRLHRMYHLFERPQNICDNRFNKGISIVENERQQPIVMTMVPPIQLFIEGMKLYLNDDLRCSGLMQAKRSEMVYLLNCYYPIKELAAFYAPIYRYSHSFQYFVMQNYQKAKDVETFAQLGGYSVPTFRRIFKDTFGEPAYQWMLKRKCQDIHNDLIMTELSISEICYKYGFESLSNFSHFCRANFGQSPRSVRSLKDENT